jgi:hypothetical protein
MRPTLNAPITKQMEYTAADIERLVAEELAAYSYVATPSGTTVGIPWSEAKERASIEALRRHLATPYQCNVLFGDTEEELSAGQPAKMVWIVAERQYIVFFDPESQSFGLATRNPNRPAPNYISVTGDLVYAWGAQ